MIKPHHVQPFLYQMIYAYDQYFANQEKNQQPLEERKGEIDKMIADLEDENYIEIIYRMQLLAECYPNWKIKSNKSKKN